MKLNTCLESISITYFPIDEEAALALKDLLARNRNIKSLDLSLCTFLENAEDVLEDIEDPRLTYSVQE